MKFRLLASDKKTEVHVGVMMRATPATVVTWGNRAFMLIKHADGAADYAEVKDVFRIGGMR